MILDPIKPETKIFLLNGPPSSGKDSLASYIESINKTFSIDKFAKPLKEANKGMFSLTDEEFNLYDTDAKLKNTPQDRFYGKSWRQVNIDLSEDFIKGKYDIKFFGLELAKRIAVNDKKRILVPDSGFLDEAVPIVEKFGKNNVFLLKLHREGFTYKGDSRNYIDGEKLGVKTFNIVNDNLNKFLADASRIIYSLTYE